MKRLIFILAVLIPFSVFGQPGPFKLRRGFIATQDGDSISCIYQNGEWVLESNTDFVILTSGNSLTIGTDTDELSTLEVNTTGDAGIYSGGDIYLTNGGVDYVLRGDDIINLTTNDTVAYLSTVRELIAESGGGGVIGDTITANYIYADEELEVRDTSIVELIEAYSAGASVSATNGLSEESPGVIGLGGNATKNTTINGNLYDFNIGSITNRFGNLGLYAGEGIFLRAAEDIFIRGDENMTLRGDNMYFIAGDDSEEFWELTPDIMFNVKDTVALLSDVRDAEPEIVLPFNFDYEFSSTTTNSRPGPGLMRLNNISLASVTEMYIDDIDGNSVDRSGFIQQADSGSVLYIQSNTDNIYALYRVSGGFVDSTGYTTYKVTYQSDVGSSITDADEVTWVLDNNKTTGSSGGGGIADSTFVTVTADTVKTPLITDIGGDIEIILNDNRAGIFIKREEAGIGSIYSEADHIQFNSDDIINFNSNSYFYRIEDNIFYADGSVGTTENTAQFTNFVGDSANLRVATVDSLGFSDGSDNITGTGNGKELIQETEFDYLKFGLALPDYEEGLAFYDSIEHAFSFYTHIPGFKEELGRGLNVIFYNNTGSTITEGTMIRSVGSKVNGAITFQADLAGIGSVDSLFNIGMATVDVLDGTYGFATYVGDVNGLNTSAFSDNDRLYLSYTGTYTNIPPETPDYRLPIGIVKYADADSGVISINIGEPVLYPDPNLFAQFYRESEEITVTTQDVAYLITNATNDLYTEGDNVAFTFDGDTSVVQVAGHYIIEGIVSFYGDDGSNVNWALEIQVNGVTVSEQQRGTTTSILAGNMSVMYSGDFDVDDSITLRITNLDGTDSPTFVSGSISIEFKHL